MFSILVPPTAVAQPQPELPTSLRVTCLTCHEVLEAQLTTAPQVVKCPFCEAQIGVPSQAQAQRILRAKGPLPAPPVEEYSIAPPSVQPAAGSLPVAKPKKAKPKSAQRADESPTIAVICPTCHERMNAVVGERIAKIPCTFCGTAVPVPDRATVAQRKTRPVQPATKRELGEYTVLAPPPRVPLQIRLFEKMAEIRTEAPVPAPRWTFFSGVFSFPWRKDAVIRWGWISIGLTFVSIALTALMITGPDPSGGGTVPTFYGVVGLGFFGLPILWISLWTLSFSADCCLRILESTAHGMDQIEAWPEGGWKEWMPHLMYLGWIAAIPLVAGYGIGCLARLGGVPLLPVMAGVWFLLYPIALLSALEANSVWIPLTGTILKSLIMVWWGWLLFYLLTGSIAAVLGALLYFGIPRAPFLVTMAFGPLLAAGLFISTRLLGRLAWKIGQVWNA